MSDYKSMYEANIFGPLRLIQLLSPSLVNTAARTDRDRTIVFNIGSASRHIPVPWTGAYFPAKVSSPFPVSIVQSPDGYHSLRLRSRLYQRR